MKRYTILFCCALTACGGQAAPRGPSADTTDPVPDQRPLASTLVYECDGYQFVARPAPGAMTLWLEDRSIVLPQVRSASGALYEEGNISFWSKGEESMLTVAGQIHRNCHLLSTREPWEEARRRGVDFRGIGNEPGWYLEIRSGQQLLLVADFGAQRVIVPDAGEERVGLARVHRGATGEHDLRIEIVDESCADTMSGEIFPSRVTVTLNNITYHGCGQTLHLD